jgi:hypothetical protein
MEIPANFNMTANEYMRRYRMEELHAMCKKRCLFHRVGRKWHAAVALANHDERLRQQWNADSREQGRSNTGASWNASH